MSHRAGAVASRSIELALRGERFQAADVRRSLSDPPSRSTTYRVLRQLEEDGWITQRGNGWHPDVKAQMLRGSDRDDEEDRDRGGPLVDVDDVL